MEKSNNIKIGILGAESTGKTELCKKLAQHYKSFWREEYARTYFQHNDINNVTEKNLIEIGRWQIENELALNAKRILFCDTNNITLKIWSVLDFGKIPDEIEALDNSNDFDFYLVTANDLPWKADGLRKNKHDRNLILEMNLEHIHFLNKPYAIIEGFGNKRFENALLALIAVI